MSNNNFSSLLDKHFKMNQDYLIDLTQDILEQESVSNFLFGLCVIILYLFFLPFNIVIVIRNSNLFQTTTKLSRKRK